MKIFTEIPVQFTCVTHYYYYHQRCTMSKAKKGPTKKNGNGDDIEAIVTKAVQDGISKYLERLEALEQKNTAHPSPISIRRMIDGSIKEAMENQPRDSAPANNILSRRPEMGGYLSLEELVDDKPRASALIDT